jgi:squalene synthase HpnD
MQLGFEKSADTIPVMASASSSTALAADTEARDHVRAVTRAAGSSFYWGMRILPEERRGAMFAIYAFCRAVDDIADGPGSVADKNERLTAWREAIDALYAPLPDLPEDPTLRALSDAIARYDLPREEFHAVIDGMQMDMDGSMKAPSAETLQLYCRRVAGAVGLLSIRVFGDAGAAAHRFAVALGEALQLTNILRDLKDDAVLDRLYLPEEHLAAQGIDTSEPDRVLTHPSMPAACAALAEDARRLYAEADVLLSGCDRRALKPAIIMKESYRRVLDSLVAAGWQDLDHDPGISIARKLWITLRHGFV